MPQLQVISRQEDPVAKQLSEFGNDLSATIQKSQALKQTAEYYKLMSKGQDNEMKKFEYDKKAKGAEYMAGIMEKVKDPKLRGLAFKSGMDAGIINMDILHDAGTKAKEYHDILTQQTPEEGADIAKTKAEAAKATADQVQNTTITNILRQQMGLPPVEGGGGGTQAAPSQQPVGDPAMSLNDGSVGDASGNPITAARTANMGTQSAQPANFPPGSQLSVGGLTMPLNQRLTDTEQGTVAGMEKFEPIVNDITSLIQGGALSKGNRTYNQLLADGGQNMGARLLTKDNSKLERLASSLSELKKYAFTEGGKTLSPTEQQIVNAGLSLTGKSNAQAVKDINESIRILKSKSGLALGGSNAAKSRIGALGGSNDFSTMSDDELRRIANSNGG